MAARFRAAGGHGARPARAVAQPRVAAGRGAGPAFAAVPPRAAAGLGRRMALMAARPRAVVDPGRRTAPMWHRLGRWRIVVGYQPLWPNSVWWRQCLSRELLRRRLWLSRRHLLRRNDCRNPRLHWLGCGRSGRSSRCYHCCCSHCRHRKCLRGVDLQLLSAPVLPPICLLTLSASSIGSIASAKRSWRK